ncbi:MAG TPA: acyl-CoA reductase [Polyangiaceae bacterium]
MRRLVSAAGRVYADRARLAPAIARSTGLTPEGVELGFASLEREATDTELEALVARAGHAERVHVILSANVFVAPLRALAVARAAAPRVTVRPSPRDPALTRALVEATGEDAVALAEDRDVAAIDAGELHVYGSDETIATIRADVGPGVVVRGHGSGLGLAVVSGGADVESAAEAIAGDVVAFDQRGCLSPRVVLVEGDEGRGAALARTLHDRLAAWSRRVPRGALTDDERVDAVRWRGALAFAGSLWSGPDHEVALAPRAAPLAIPPAGRHVLVSMVPRLDGVAPAIAAVARFVVAVGTDDVARVSAFVPPHARLSALGRMQRPPLDGPVDRRAV